MAVKIADKWFLRKVIDDQITLLWEPHVHPLLRCNIWHIKGRDRDLVIDTGLGICSLKEAAKDIFGKNILAVATHTHYDHIGGFHEFDHCAVHRCEAHGLIKPEEATLFRDDIPQDELESIVNAGYVFNQNTLITAQPSLDYNIADFKIKPANANWLLDDGDIIDTGDRNFKVLHTPGHSPGSIGLWEEKTGTLFSGDTIYDGPLLADIPGSNLSDYLKSMSYLSTLDVKVVHGGHGDSFGKELHTELINNFLKLHS